ARVFGPGYADSRGRLARQRLQSFQRKCEMSSTLVIGDGVDFIDDYSFDFAQDGTTLLGGEQDVQRFWRSDEDVWGANQHGTPLVHQRIACTDRSADLGHQESTLASHLQDLAPRDFKILLNIVPQGFERGDVQDLRTILEFASQSLAH